MEYMKYKQVFSKPHFNLKDGLFYSGNVYLIPITKFNKRSLKKSNVRKIIS